MDRVIWYHTTEYEINYFEPFSHLHDHDIPCAVCRVIGRSTLLMMPAKTTCPPDWTSEYKGYLMSAHYRHVHQSEYLCVDKKRRGSAWHWCRYKRSPLVPRGSCLWRTPVACRVFHTLLVTSWLVLSVRFEIHSSLLWHSLLYVIFA